MIKMSLHESEEDLVTRRSRLGVLVDKLIGKHNRYDDSEEEVEILIPDLRPARIKLKALDNILRKLRTKY